MTLTFAQLTLKPRSHSQSSALSTLIDSLHVGSYSTEIPGRSIDLFEVVNRRDEGVDDILRLSGSAEAVLGRAPSSVSSLGGYGSRSAGCPVLRNGIIGKSM